MDQNTEREKQEIQHTSFATKNTKSHIIMTSIDKNVFICDNSTIAFYIVVSVFQMITLQQLHHQAFQILTKRSSHGHKCDMIHG